jgi:hypothetical protein
MYECDICKALYETTIECLACEAVPVQNPHKIGIGSRVRITDGPYKELYGMVKNMRVRQKVTAKAKHTIAITVEVVGTIGYSPDSNTETVLYPGQYEASQKELEVFRNIKL